MVGLCGIVVTSRHIFGVHTLLAFGSCVVVLEATGVAVKAASRVHVMSIVRMIGVGIDWDEVNAAILNDDDKLYEETVGDMDYILVVDFAPTS